MRKQIYYLGLSGLLFFGCSKDDIEPLPAKVYSSVPEIKVGLSQDSVQQFESLTFEIFYRDGDGNIGTADADDHAVEIIDRRADIVHTYHVPPLSEIPNVIIQGILTVELENIILLNQNNNSEQVSFEVRLKDSAGNWSDKYQTRTVIITK